MGGVHSAVRQPNSTGKTSPEAALLPPPLPTDQPEIQVKDSNDSGDEVAESFSDWRSSPAPSQRSSLGSGAPRQSSHGGMSSPPSGSHDAPSSSGWLGQRPSADTPLHPSLQIDRKESGGGPPQGQRVSAQFSQRTSGSTSSAHGVPSPGASARSSFALERAGIEANRLSLEAFNEAYNASTRGGRAPEPISQQAYSSLELPEDNGPLDMLRVMLGIPDEIRDQFAALCTLPPQTPAPATTLAKLWGVREDEVSPTLTTLAEKGVLSMAQLPNGQIWALPQGERLELLQNATREVASMYHARLIDAYARDALEKQADVQEHTLIDRIQDAEVQARALALVPDDGYSLANLAHHLMGAERLATARAMLLDPEWLERKLRACGAAAVVADFRRYLLVSPGKDVKLVLEAFQMSVGLMTSHNDVPGLLRCLMASRLMTVPLSAHMQRWLAAQKEAMRKDAERAAAAGRACCLPAQTPSLDQTGGLQRLALKGHKGAVTKVLLTPSGCDAVSASADGTVRVWDLEIGDCVLVLEGHARAITDMAITADGSLLVTTSEDGTARAYEMEQGQCLRVLAGHEGGITSLALDPYGRFVVTGSSDGTARVWDLASARSLHTLSSPDSSVCSVALSPCTRYALLGCSDGGVRLFDVISGQLMGSMLGHTAEVSAVAFSKDGKRCLSASHDGTLRTWSLKSGSLKRNMDGRAGRIDAIIVSPNGKLAVAGYEDGSVRLWELVTGTCIKVLQGHKQWVSTVAMSPSGERLLTASADGTAIAWNTDTGEVVRVLEGHSGAVLSAAITQRGRFAVTTSEDGSVRVWDFAASSSHTPKWHAGRIRALTAHDGLVVATAGEDCVARLWDGALGEYRGLLQGHAVPIRWSMFARDGTRLVTASPDRTVCVWDVQTMELLHKLPDHKGSRMKSFAASGDLSTAVVCLFDSTVTVWDLNTGSVTVPLQRWGERDETKGHTSAVNEVLMTVDGSTVVTMSKDSTSRVWDAKDGTCMHVLRGHTDSVIGGCLSDEGRILATHSFDNTARLWSLDGGACLATIDLKTSIGRMALSSAGSYLATAMTDGTVLLRDLAHPREEIVVRGHSDEVTDLSFASDERLLTTCSLDCTARLVDVATGALRGVFVSDCGLTCCHYDSVTHLIVAGTDRGVVHFVDASLPLNVL